MKGPVAFPMQYAESMIALTVTLFVWPAVTLESQDKPNTNPVSPITTAREWDLQKIIEQHWPMIHCTKRRPILLDQGKKLTRKTPKRFGMKKIAPTYARLLGIREAIVTPTHIVTISMTPSTHESKVVCRKLNPNEDTIIWRWLRYELGTLSRIENNAKSHVFGSVRASIILRISGHTVPDIMVRLRTGLSWTVCSPLQFGFPIA